MDERPPRMREDPVRFRTRAPRRRTRSRRPAVRISGFQPEDAGFESRLGHNVRGLRSTVGPQSSKLPTRVRLPPPAPSRFSDEDRGLQNRARGFDSLSALQAPLAQRKGHRLLSDPIQVRLLGGALHVPVI